ncbi:MAG: hypothetical protein GX950_03420 [Candidatus Diapherotrites archaeon]|jgi:hypothetical protein|uniref:Uncharacterized protein n=1 Tax=Candidatus Iainarchaeum sp. TaxID=3101447 RepID=A0A7K4C097_9ARCH|nr:hypothetical protein [Candidatus Diapherotrites archaeon]
MTNEIELKELAKKDKGENSIKPKTNDEIKRDMNKIISELKQKMQEIDSITKELEEKSKNAGSGAPQKTKKLLEEIKVPSLEILK